MFPGNICVCVSGFLPWVFDPPPASHRSVMTGQVRQTLFVAVFVFIFFKAHIALLARVCKLCFWDPNVASV